MIQITESEIRKAVSNTINYRIGMRYLHMDMVQYLQVTQDFFYYHIKAIIVQNEYVNRCEILLNERMEVESTSCSCPFHTDDSACAHIAMLLMYVNELDIEELPYVYGSKDVPSEQERHAAKMEERRQRQEQLRLEYEERLREYQRQEQQIRMNQTKQWLLEEKQHLMHRYLADTSARVMLELSCFNIDYGYQGTRFQLEVRIGITRMYKVKDVSSLIAAVETKEKVRYGKELDFIHDIEAFDEASKQILHFLYINQNANSYSYDRKHPSVSSSLLEEFFLLCDSLPPTHCTITTETLQEPLHVTIHEREHGYQLELMEYAKLIDSTLGTQGLYKINKTTLRQYQFQENDLVMRLLYAFFQEEEGLLVNKEDMRDFYKYVLYPIKEDVIISGCLKECTLEDVDILNLYGDVDEQGMVSIKLEGTMDEKRVYGFDTTLDPKPLTLEIVESYLHNFISVVDEGTHTAYLREDDDSAFTLIKDGLPFLSQYCEIFVSDALKRIGSTHHVNLSAGIRLSNGLLEMDVSSMDIQKEELMDVLKAYRRKRKYHRLKNGNLLYLDTEELQKLDEIVEELHVQEKDMQDGLIRLPAYRVFQMEEIANQNDSFLMEQSLEFHQLTDAFQKVDLASFPIPAHYESILRDYQKYGFQWLKLMNHYHFGAILADDMGLGKTLQIIALLESEKGKGTSIVVTPSSLLLNWKDEIEKFASTLSTLCVLGNAAQRKRMISDAGSYDILITSYDYLRRDIELYKEQKFYYIVLDEAQYIKNHKTKNAQVVKALQGEHRIALSGTPIENTLAELWSIFDFLMPNYLFNYHHFQQKFEKLIVKEKNEQAQNRLKTLVSPFILRRNKKDVLTELPDKVEHTLTIPFQEEEQKLYLASLAQVSKELQQKMQMEGLDKMQVLAMLTRLRQICCEPRILYENITTASSKLNACIELILSLKEANQKVLLFSSFTSVLDLLEDEFYKYHISYLSLTGKTKKEERQALVKSFQEGNTDVFLISLKAGGTGLNLTAAQAVIHFDPWWNVSAQNQATDRAYRIGQEKNVQVFKLIMKDSIEEKILKLQVKKKDLADTFVENNTGGISSMDLNEIMDLFQ